MSRPEHTPRRTPRMNPSRTNGGNLRNHDPSPMPRLWKSHDRAQQRSSTDASSAMSAPGRSQGVPASLSKVRYQGLRQASQSAAVQATSFLLHRLGSYPPIRSRQPPQVKIPRSYPIGSIFGNLGRVTTENVAKGRTL